SLSRSASTGPLKRLCRFTSEISFALQDPRRDGDPVPLALGIFVYQHTPKLVVGNLVGLKNSGLERNRCFGPFLLNNDILNGRRVSRDREPFHLFRRLLPAHG